jgi:hypothetical protein
MRALCLLLVLATSSARAEPPRELASSVHASFLQEGTMLLLAADGMPEHAPTRVGAGYYLTLTGYERLSSAMAQCQADTQAERARAEALQASIALVPARSSSTFSTGTVALVAVALVLAGGVAGYTLGRR